MKPCASVAVFAPVRALFSYSFAEVGAENLSPGVRVVVPFGRRELVGVFIGFRDSDVETKEIRAVLDAAPLYPEWLVELALWCADYYVAGPGELFRMMGPRESLKKRVVYKKLSDVGKGRALTAEDLSMLSAISGELSANVFAKKAGLTVGELEKRSKPLIKKGLLEKTERYCLVTSKMGPENTNGGEPAGEPRVVVELTKEQKAAVAEISAKMEARSGRTTLLHGVTGSGKTEVYAALCEKALSDGGGAIVLVPEIAITYQLVRRFRSRFGGEVALLHSGLTPAQRREEWKRIYEGRARLVIGARSAVFAPLAGPRLVVVDEEHDGSYKQGERPHYNARDVAVMLGKITGAAVVLGSATPSLETYFNAQAGKYSLCRLTHRIDHRPMPFVSFVGGDKAGGSPVPTAVLEKMAANLGRGGQSLVFINRRGAAVLAKCRVCGSVARCPNCSISLTYHSAGSRLLCHYCGFELPSKTCPTCKTGGLLSFRGSGTQKVESFLREMLPKAAVERLDHDVAGTREKTFAILEKFEKGEADVLVGTQMTAKGHDFPNLTFTAVLGADEYLSFPDFRAAERVFSLVTQAAGRTGRGEKPGEVLIFGGENEHAVLCAARHDYDAFYGAELENRRKTGFPPFSRLIGIMFESPSQSRLEKAMTSLMKKMPPLPAGVTALGPVPVLVYKLRNRYRWKMLLKGGRPGALRSAALLVEKAVDGGAEVSIDVDPSGFF